MTHIHFLFGIQIEREARLCFRSPNAQNNTPFDSGKNLEKKLHYVDKIDTGVRELASLAWEVINPKPDAETLKNLNDERKWVDAFSLPNIFTDPVQQLPKPPYGPERYLLHLTPPKRLERYVEFVQRVIPPGARGTHYDIFDDPAFQTEDLDDHMQKRIQQNLPPTIEITDNQKKDIDYTLGLMLGRNYPKDAEHGRAYEIAWDSYKEYYPKGAEDGRLHRDYAEDRRLLMEQRPEMTHVSFERPDVMLRALDQQGIESRFRGALRTGYINELMLRELAKDFDEREINKNIVFQEEQSKMHLIDREIGARLNRESRTFTQNFETLPGWGKFALIGIGTYLMYKMFTAKDKDGNPRWIVNKIPLALLGYWGYQRLIKGDEHAIDNMGNKIQDKVNLSLDALGQIPGMHHIIGTDEPDQLAIMAKYLDQKAFENIRPPAVAFACMAEVELGLIAAAFRPDGDATGNITLEQGYSPLPANANPRSRAAVEGSSNLFTQAMRGIARKRNYDWPLIEDYFRTNNKEIGQALAVFFMQLAGQTEQYRDMYGRVEKARSSSMDPHMQYADIPDETIKADMAKLVREGMKIARGDGYKKLKFTDLIQKLSKKGPEQDKHKGENADKIDNPEQLPTRSAERALRGQARVLSVSQQPLPVLQPRIVADYQQFLHNYSEAARPGNALLDDGAKAELDKHFNQIISNNTSATDVLLLIEELKYAIIVAGFRDKLPLKKEDIDDMMRGTFESYLKAVESWINRNLFIITGSLQNIEGMDNVRALISNYRPLRKIEAPDQKAITELQEKLDAYKGRFNDLRNSIVQATQAFARLSSAQVQNLGGPDAARKFLKSLYDSPEYQARITRGEKYFARKLGQDIVEAMLMTHRTDGIHTLDLPAQRALTRIEAYNIQRRMDVLYKWIEGEGDGSGEGWEWQSTEAADVGYAGKDIRKEAMSQLPTREALVNHCSHLANLALSMGQNTPTRLLLLQRIGELVDKYLKYFNARTSRTLLPDVEDLLKRYDIQQNADDKRHVETLRKILIILSITGLSGPGLSGPAVPGTNPGASGGINTQPSPGLSGGIVHPNPGASGGIQFRPGASGGINIQPGLSGGIIQPNPGASGGIQMRPGASGPTP